MTQRAIAAAIGMTVASLLFSGEAKAERFVVVNGERLTNPDIVQLEQIACTPIPNGRYWLHSSGVWGYEGNPQPQGRVGDCCRMNCQRPSLSQRGMLFSPYDWVR